MVKPLRESQIEAYGKKRAEAAGGVVRKVKWVGRTAAPDRVLMLPEWCKPIRFGFLEMPGETIWVEFKAPGKKPTAAQLREHERMRAVGQTVLVWDSIEAIDRWFEGR